MNKRLIDECQLGNTTMSMTRPGPQYRARCSELTTRFNFIDNVVLAKRSEDQVVPFTPQMHWVLKEVTASDHYGIVTDWLFEKE